MAATIPNELPLSPVALECIHRQLQSDRDLRAMPQPQRSVLARQLFALPMLPSVVGWVSKTAKGCNREVDSMTPAKPVALLLLFTSASPSFSAKACACSAVTWSSQLEPSDPSSSG